LYEDFFEIKQDFDWTTEYLLANMKIIYKHAAIIMKNPNNYDSRANIL
jgi:alcohol dehydrogenase YqhD (iron-dependent ADH family)